MAAVTLTRLMDNTTGIPGTASTFTTFFQPGLDGSGNVVFMGSAPGYSGILRYDGSQITEKVRRGDAVPGSLGTVSSSVSAPVLHSSGSLGFRGSRSTLNGVYFTSASGHQLGADTGTAYPPTGGTFSGFSNYLDFNGSQVVFAGYKSFTSDGGVFLSSGGGLTTVADVTTVVPGTVSDTFLQYNSARFDGGDVVFHATRGATTGFFRWTGGIVTRVVDSRDANPSTGTNFTSFRPFFSMDGGDMAFQAQASGVNGYFALIGGNLVTLADNQTTVPGLGGELFRSTYDADEIALAGGRALFARESAGTQTDGLYLWENNSLTALVQEGDVLDGQTVSSVTVTSFGLNASRGVFQVSFTDATQAVYQLDFSTPASSVPEPRTVLMMMLGLPMLRSLRRWKPAPTSRQRVRVKVRRRRRVSRY